MKSRTLISCCQRPPRKPSQAGINFSRAALREAVVPMEVFLTIVSLTHLNPSIVPVWRAIISSSLVGITHAETLLWRVDMRGPLPSLASKSNSIPNHADSSHIPRRISGGFSPIPAVKTDAGSKDQCVDAPERSSQRANFLSRAIDEIVYCETRFRLAATEQIAHIVTDSRDREQTRLLIQNGFYILW